MTPDLAERLAALKFVPDAMPGVMRGRLEDVTFTAVVHPIRGLVLMGYHVSSRTAVEFEVALPVGSTVRRIAQAMLEIYEQIHPESKDRRS